MFNKDGFIEIGDEIFVYKHFMSDEECESIMKDILSLPEDVWQTPFLATAKDYFISEEQTESIRAVKKRIASLMLDECYATPGGRASKLLKGASRRPHADIDQFKEVEHESRIYKEGDDFDLADLITHGTIIYFNDFEGGEVYYPEQNDLQYKPEKGDLVIHGAQNKCKHGVDEVLSDVRYFSVGHFFKHVKVSKGHNFRKTPLENLRG
jgi:hypothetical protein